MKENKNKEAMTAPDWYLKLEAMYLEAFEKKLAADEEMEKVRLSIQTMMENEKLPDVETDLTQTHYYAQSTSRKFNSTNFKKDYPELYEQYATKYSKRAYVAIKLLKQPI